MYNKFYVTFLVGYDGILMCSYIVKELLTACHGILRRFGLGGCNCTKCCEHSGIYDAFIVEENTDHFLDDFFQLERGVSMFLLV